MASLTQTIYIDGHDQVSIESAILRSIERARHTLTGVTAFSVETMGGLVDESGTPSFRVEVGVEFEVRDPVGHGI